MINRVVGYQTQSKLPLTFLSIFLAITVVLTSCIPSFVLPPSAPPASAPTPTPSTAPTAPLSAPKLITPYNGATDIQLRPRFLWQPVPEAKGYELWVSLNSDFSEVIHNVSLVLTSYQPSSDLSPSTRYYWMVAAKLNPADPNSPVACSAIWTFTIAQQPAPTNHAPNIPSNPSPANHATDVSSLTLSWSGGDPDQGDRVSYDIYFGTVSPPHLVSKHQFGTTYDPGPVPLLVGTKCYWKIIAMDNHGALTGGPLWDFTAAIASAVPPPPPASPPSLLRSPSGHPDVMKQYITPNDPKVKAAVQDILSGYWRWAYDDFEALRQWVQGHVSYRSDMDVHGVRNYWQLPAETLEFGTGDCEDFAILLCTLLRANGVGSDEVYVAVGCDSQNHCHAYLFERYYKGIWRVIEPQAELFTVLLFFNSDLYTDLIYDERYCFNDRDYIEGMPTLSPGIYAFEIGYSSWPVTRGASVVLQRQLSVAERISGTVEWLQQYAENPDIIYDWSFNIYGPDNDIVFTWSGTDKGLVFSFVPAQPGPYRIEILKRDYMPRCARLTIDPPDWRRR